MKPAWQYAIAVDAGDQHAHRMAPSFWMTVERSMPDRDQTFTTPSSPAVSRPAPSGLQRPVVMAVECAAMFRSTRADLFRIIKRPSLLVISNKSPALDDPELLPPPSFRVADEDDPIVLDCRTCVSQCRSVGKKSSGSLATGTGSRVLTFHLYSWWSSLKQEILKWILRNIIGLGLTWRNTPHRYCSNPNRLRCPYGLCLWRCLF